VSVPVELTRRTRPLKLAPAPSPTRRDRWKNKARLARFLALSKVKQHAVPSLHVRPIVAELFLTDNCNLTCVSCACWRTTTRGELTTAEWVDVVDQLAGLGFVKLNFTGGEALTRRDAARVISAAARRGIFDLHLNTNGVLLDEDRLNEVVAAGIRSFNLSLDGSSAAVHDAVRGRSGAFNLTVDAVSRIVARRERDNLDVQVNFTVLADNVDDLVSIAQLTQRLGVRLYLNLGTDTTFLFRHADVSGRIAVDEGRLRDGLAWLTTASLAAPGLLPPPSALSYIPSHFGFEKAPPTPCVESQLKLMVHSTGGVGGCWGHDPTFNVRDRSIASIIDSDHYREEHVRFFRKDCVRCGSNYALNERTRVAAQVGDVGRRAAWSLQQAVDRTSRRGTSDNWAER